MSLTASPENRLTTSLFYPITMGFIRSENQGGVVRDGNQRVLGCTAALGNSSVVQLSKAIYSAFLQEDSNHDDSCLHRESAEDLHCHVSSVVVLSWTSAISRA